MNPGKKNTILLFSDANFFGLTLLEYLISKNFIVYIISSDFNNWKARTNHITLKNKFDILKDAKNISYENAVYKIYVLGYGSQITKPIVKSFTKTLILSPFEKFDHFKSLIPKSENVAAIYLGDLIGPRMDIHHDLLINKVISNVLNSHTIEVSVGELFYPVYVLDVVKKIFNYLFSFGPYGKSIILLGEEKSSKDLWHINSVFFKDLKFSLNTKSIDRKLPEKVEREIIKSDISNALKLTYKWHLAQKENENNFREKKPNKSVFRKFILTVLFLLITPYLSLLAAGCFYYSAFLNYKQSKILAAEPLLILSKETSRFFSAIPFAGKVYKETQLLSDLSIQAGNVIMDAYPIAKSFSDLPAVVLGSSSLDVDVFNPDQHNQIYKVSEDLSFIDSTLKSDYYNNLYLARYVTAKIDFQKLKVLGKEIANISKYLGSILGEKQSKKYLILFQNNMELRPTGGFIGSYGLISFENNKLKDLNVSDIYSADGQLKGHVEPPAPIRDILNEANWYFRDSNWDPDFTISAKRAEWFLDKEIGERVDGVVAIDLSPIKDILEVTGPIFLADYNMEITSNNLYERTQEEVESNFFAGSRKKASFLTALSRNLIGRFAEMTPEEKMKLLLLVYNNLEKRHIQIFLHEEAVQKSLSVLNWDGAVKVPVCNDECYADVVGMVEANLGVNKVNQFINRNVELDVNIGDKFIKRTLTIDYINTASVSLGPSGRYRMHLRTIRQPDSLEKDEGQFVEILPSSNSKVVIEWSSPKSSNLSREDYKIYYRKQAGVESYPFSLTVDGKNLYNGELDRDLFINY